MSANRCSDSSGESGAASQYEHGDFVYQVFEDYLNTEFHDSVHVVLIDAVTDSGDWYAGSFNDAYNELLYGDGSNDNGLIDIMRIGSTLW